MTTFETFVIAVYVIVDEYWQQHPPPPVRRGPRPRLSRSEVTTLALLAQLPRFSSERDFARFAATHLAAWFPGLPERSQLNRLFRRAEADLVRLGQDVGEALGRRFAPYEVLDTTAVPIRTTKRRGLGFLPEVATVGYSLRLGWFTGFKLLLATTPDGLITGYGLAAGHENDRSLADTFLSQRTQSPPLLPSVGRPGTGLYLADTGFAGRAARQRWRQRAGAQVLAAPQRDSGERWPRAWRRWHTRHRQIVETVFQRLLQGYRLERDRPHTLGGVLSRLAAKVALHHIVIHINRAGGRPDLAVAETVGW